MSNSLLTQRIKSSMEEVQASVEEIENSYTFASRKTSSDQVKRLRDKLRVEWNSLKDAYKERHERLVWYKPRSCVPPFITQCLEFRWKMENRLFFCLF